LLRRHVTTHAGNDSVGQVKELKFTAIIASATQPSGPHSNETDAPGGTARANIEGSFRVGIIGHGFSGLKLIDSFGCQKQPVRNET
jgi:hypothetical protein